jgi:hypothetical protein
MSAQYKGVEPSAYAAAPGGAPVYGAPGTYTGMSGYPGGAPYTGAPYSAQPPLVVDVAPAPPLGAPAGASAAGYGGGPGYPAPGLGADSGASPSRDGIPTAPVIGSAGSIAPGQVVMLGLPMPSATAAQCVWVARGWAFPRADVRRGGGGEEGRTCGGARADT